MIFQNQKEMMNNIMKNRKNSLRIIHTHIEQKEKTGRNGLKAVSM